VSIGKQVEWYKRMNLYVVYADAFRNGKRGDFFSLAKNLEYIKETGFDAIHVLPFLESPMQDAGFDVSDFFRVRKRLGGNEGFEVFLREVGRLKMKVFMDLVVNHVSMEHEWFKKAVSGDEYYRNFFIHTPVQPKLIEVEDDRWGKWARYRLNRRELRSRIIFLNQNGELPHWFRGEDVQVLERIVTPHLKYGDEKTQEIHCPRKRVTSQLVSIRSEQKRMCQEA